MESLLCESRYSKRNCFSGNGPQKNISVSCIPIAQQKRASLDEKDEEEGKLFQTAARACNESTFVTVYVSFCYRGMDKSWVMRRPLLRR